MARIAELGPAEPVRTADHVLVVKHDDGRFEVTGTAGAGEADARYLTPQPFDDQDAALRCAEAFATAHGLPVIYLKGFRMMPAPV